MAHHRSAMSIPVLSIAGLTHVRESPLLSSLITLALLSLFCSFLQNLHFRLIFLPPSMLGFKYESIPSLSWVFIFSRALLAWRISVLSLAYIATSTLTIYKYIAATQPFHPAVRPTHRKLYIQHLHVESPLVSQV